MPTLPPPFNPAPLLAHLKESGTGAAKLEALAKIKEEDREKWLKEAAAVVPEGTRNKIAAFLAEQDAEAEKAAESPKAEAKPHAHKSEK